ncbi:MAG: ATP-binding cassette domain-containing protein [Povalibacter sp.]
MGKTQATSAGSSGKGNVLRLYKSLWAEAVGKRGMFVSAMSLLAFAQCILLAIPYCAGKAINVLQVHGIAGLGEAGLWVLSVVGITACSWVFHGPGRILERNVALAVRERIATQLIQKLLSLPLAWHESQHSGATAHRVQQSSHALTGFAQSQFIYLSSAVRLMGPLAALCWLEPLVGIAALTGFIVTAVCTMKFDRAMIRLAHQENDAERRYSSAMIDSLGNATTVLALRQNKGVIALMQSRLATVFVPLRRSIVLNEAKWCTVDLSTKILSGGLVALFAWLSARHAGSVAKGTVMLGSLFMVWEYAQQASGVISAFASHFQTFARQHADYASADMIREAADRVEAPAQDATNTKSPTVTRLHIHDLSFQHLAGRAAGPTLDHVRLVLEAGKRYALVGTSGCGKSTLLRVLAGLYTADRIAMASSHGPAMLTPRDAAQWLKTVTTLIPQDAQLFEGSLAENLALCASIRNEQPQGDLEYAVRAACVNDFVDMDHGGLELPVAQGAANWSGGQRARFALARGVLAATGSPLVLFDEPTASLDPRTEGHVYENLFDQFKDSCVISSIHRLHLLPRFDEVIVMHEGRIIEQGPTALLLQSSEHLQRLINNQRPQSDVGDERTAA